MIEQQLTERIIGALIEVHRHLGPGLLESAYCECLCREFDLIGLQFKREVPLPLNYKGHLLAVSYRLDIVVEECVVLELKSIEALLPIHEAQLISYLKLSGMRVDFLVNFNVPRMIDGIVRRVV